jgi:hypothetical protein
MSADGMEEASTDDALLEAHDSEVLFAETRLTLSTSLYC